jgi:hypothetical protein
VTTREIADAVGKPERTVRGWANKMAAKSAAMAAKLAASNSTHPADYDLDEAIEIIGAGLGRNAAEVYRQNAVHEVQLVPEPVDYMKLAEIIAATVGAVIDRAITRMVTQQPRQLMLEAPITHMSLMGFIRSRGEKSPDIETLKRIGAALSARCRDRNLTITKIPDERYGTVNGYPMEALEEYFTL